MYVMTSTARRLPLLQQAAAHCTTGPCSRMIPTVRRSPAWRIASAAVPGAPAKTPSSSHELEPPQVGPPQASKHDTSHILRPEPPSSNGAAPAGKQVGPSPPGGPDSSHQGYTPNQAHVVSNSDETCTAPWPRWPSNNFIILPGHTDCSPRPPLGTSLGLPGRFSEHRGHTSGIGAC